MAVTYLGVRHHSPACARLVAETIERLRPAYVLVEGPADFNERIDELLLGHDLPVAIFTHYRDESRAHASWTPFCSYSPEWVALTAGRACGARLRFIDLPGWHPAFAERRNRYADAEERYAEVTARLCRSFAVDNTDTLWDHLIEVDPGEDLADRLTTYFDLVRGESAVGPDDTAREEYMARWIRAAAAAATTATTATTADPGPVVVVTGGFHAPALRALVERDGRPDDRWPRVPRPPDGAVGGSYLVPYSFRRLDSFTGYQSGMPSPEYYQRLWESGPERAAAALTEIVVTHLRERRQPVSTADLIAARTLTDGLARLRGHRVPARTDLLDGLVAALVADDLEQPLPWTTRGPIAAGTHPAVAAILAALRGSRTGRLHPDTPAPPLLRDATAELERLGLDGRGEVVLRLTGARDLHRSRVLHRMRVLAIPGVDRESGPATGTDPIVEERWTLSPGDERIPALIEAGAYGAVLADAAAAVLDERTTEAGSDAGRLATVLFDAAMCGRVDRSERIAGTLAAGIAAANDVGALGRVLATVLALWRHDRVLGTARSPLFGTVIAECVNRLLWLVEGVRGGPAPADLDRLHAMVATRDALLHATAALGLDPDVALGVAGRIGANVDAPPDLRGAAFGLAWSLGGTADPARAVRGVAGPGSLGDWLAGLFALARDEVLAGDPAGEAARSGAAPKVPGRPGGTRADLIGTLDDLVGGLSERDFLVALPALRQAFEFFPPREREAIAQRLLDRRGLTGSVRALLRMPAEPLVIAAAIELERRVDRLLVDEGLWDGGDPA